MTELSLGQSSKKRSATRIIDEFQGDTEAIQRAPDPWLARITLHLLALLIALAIVWASVVKIDRMVVARGKVISSVPSLVVQPLETSIIRNINARSGDVVKRGQVLATLDPTFAEADVSQLHARKESLKAQVGRLEAEIADRPFVPTNMSNAFEQLQAALWRDRRSQFRAQMDNYEERLNRLNTTIAKHRADQQLLSQRLSVITEVEGMRRELAKKEVGSRLNELMARDARLEIQRSIGLSDNTIIESQHEMQSVLAEREVFIQQWRNRLHEELVTARKEEEGLSAQLAKAARIQELISLEAPTDAVVLEVAKLSVGSVIKQAEPLFTLVPLDAPLEIEASIDARDLGFVEVGDTVQVKLDAYNYLEYGTIEGKVQTISEDAFTDRNDSRMPAYYRARIRIEQVALRNIPDTFRLVPGMPLSADIRVGKRTVISYFLQPVLRGVGESFRDP